MARKLTHVTRDGKARMVDVGAKKRTARTAVACGIVRMKPSTLRAICENKVAKGNVFEVAKVAGISAAKDTARLIPLCHPLAVTHIEIDFSAQRPDACLLRGRQAVAIQTTVQAYDRTGVEMEALTATAVAALTIYDMCKAIDREMRIEEIMLMEKKGGRSGHFVRKGAQNG